jgi:15-cis-phytoene synthase
MTDAGNVQASDFDQVRLSARSHAPDRFYAALFAPSEARADLIALAAFTGEIERISRQVSEAALGEIRVAWWREAFLSRGESGRSGNPVLDAFAEVIRRRSLPLGRIEDYLSAHAAAMYGEEADTAEGFDADLIATDGTPFALAGAILGLEFDAETIALAGRAQGLTRIALELPYDTMHGRNRLPPMIAGPHPNPPDLSAEIARLAADAKAELANLRRHLSDKPRGFVTPLLPLALLEPYFRALQKAGHEPARDIVEIAPIARMWRIARAHWSGRI